MVASTYQALQSFPLTMPAGSEAGVVTNSFLIVMECLVASNGFQVGDLVFFHPMASSATSGPEFQVSRAGGAWRLRTPSATTRMLNPSTGAVFAIANANWRLRCYRLGTQ
jgi:hypothetical protein